MHKMLPSDLQGRLRSKHHRLFIDKVAYGVSITALQGRLRSNAECTRCTALFCRSATYIKSPLSGLAFGFKVLLRFEFFPSPTLFAFALAKVPTPLYIY